MSELILATDADLDDVIADGAVLVKFGAEWCGPCKMLAPVIEELAGEYAGRVKVVDVNIDDSPESAKKHGIRGIPTLVMFKDGQTKGTTVGAKRKPDIEAFVEQHAG